MPSCLFYCNLTSQLDSKPFKRVMDFWFSTLLRESRKWLERDINPPPRTSSRDPNQRREMVPFAKADVTSLRLCEKSG